MNFTWFASAYDTDDVPYRLTVFVQLIGALILAAGVYDVFHANDFTVSTAGYVIMRLAMVGQRLRAARTDVARRSTALRYAIGITLCQIGWIVLLFLPLSLKGIGFAVMVTAEILVPVWAEQSAATTWHPSHIAERYGLFTIIVLGESILSSLIAIQATLEVGGFNISMLSIIVGGLLIVFTMWWLYFDGPRQRRLTSLRVAFTWGYGHLFIFASAAAVGAGLAVAVDYATHHAEISAVAAGQAVAIPVAIYLFCLWALQQHSLHNTPLQQFLFPATAILVLLTPFTGFAVLLTGMLLASLLAI